MLMRPLGKTGIQVSEVAFGCVEIGIPYGIGVKDKKDMLSTEQAISLLHTALDKGINFFDTARHYGDSEMILGKAFKTKRDQVVIATKCHHFLEPDDRFPSYKVLKSRIEESLHQSLQALQTDYVDVFMLHQANHGILENEEVASIFNELKQSGKIRATGVSTYLVEESEKAIDIQNWDLIQLPFNLLDQRHGAVFSSAAEKGVAIIVRSVLLKGLLSSKGKDLHPALSAVQTHIGKYNRLLDVGMEELSTLATKFALSFNEVSAVLIGIDHTKYLEDALKTANGHYLDKIQLQRAEMLAYHDPDFINLPYWDKQGWLK